MCTPCAHQILCTFSARLNSYVYASNFILNWLKQLNKIEIEERKAGFQVILVLLALAGGCLLSWGTARGIGVLDDTIFYFSAAENYLAGNGLSRLGGDSEYIPLTHFPPLYSLFLAALTTLSGFNIALVARGLNLGLFGVNILMVGWLAKRLSNSWLAGTLASLWMLGSPVMVLIHKDAMTEPLFITWMLLALWGLFEYLEKPRFKNCVLAAVPAGFMLMSRYAGQGILVGITLTILTLSNRPFRTRLGHAFLFGTISVLPMVAWMIRNYLLVGSFTNRTFYFHPIDRQRLVTGWHTLLEWIAPGAKLHSEKWLSGALVLFLLGLGAFLLFRILRKTPAFDQGVLKEIISLFLILLGYLASILTSLTFFDASTPLDNRILSPIFILLVLVLFAGIWRSDIYHQYRPVRWLAVGIIIVWAILGMNASQGILGKMRQEGSLFDSPHWQNSQLVDLMRQVPSETIIYSNESLYLTYVLSRPVRQLPERSDPVKGVNRPEYLTQVAVMQDAFNDPHSLLVISRYRYSEAYYAAVDEVSTDLQICLEIEEGVFYSSGEADFPFCK